MSLKKKKQTQQPKRVPFGEALAHLMRMQGTNPVELAVMLDVPPSTIACWIQGILPPPGKKDAAAIADALGVEPRMILAALEVD